MRVLILTSSVHGTATRVLPTLAESGDIEVVCVVLSHAVTNRRWRLRWRKLGKALQIGLLGALNGVRIRKWYRDPDAGDLRAQCTHYNIPLFETPVTNSEHTRELFRQARADLGLSLGNGYIGRSVFDIPRLGMINLHTEILPRFQGAQSVIWPIHEGLDETGFTIHQIDATIDTGDILYQERYPIQFRATLQDTVVESMRETRSRIAAAVLHVCRSHEALRDEARSQEHSQHFTTPSITEFWRMLRNHRRMTSNR